MFKPLNQERTFETIVKQIKDSIYSGDFKPGDKLPTERELANTFRVSRAAVRSAVLNLEQSGFLNIKKGAYGGFFVREPDARPVTDSLNDLLKLGRASLSDLTEARLILEPQAAGLAAQRATAADLKKIEDVILDFETRIGNEEPPNPADLNFHVGIAEASMNPVIIVFMRSLMDLLFQRIAPYFLEPGRSEEINSQHKRILKAIKAKDSEKARAFMLEHVRSMQFLFGEFESPGASPDTK